MPLILSRPFNYVQRGSITLEARDNGNAPANIDRGTSTTGTIATISDGNPNSYYETTAPGLVRSSPTRNELTFRLTFTGNPRVDLVYVVADGISSATFDIVSPASSSLGTQLTGVLNSGDQRTITFPSSLPATFTPVAVSSGRLRLVKTSANARVRIYAVYVMGTLLDLRNSDDGTNGRSISRFDPSGEVRNAFIVEDLYGNRTLQTGHINQIRNIVRYTIWQISNNLTECRSELNKVKRVVQENPNFTLWDLVEPNNMDYESLGLAHWVPNSFNSSIEGQQALTYSFSIEYQ